MLSTIYQQYSARHHFRFPFTTVEQTKRIQQDNLTNAVNDKLEALREGLAQSLTVLTEEQRLPATMPLIAPESPPVEVSPAPPVKTAWVANCGQGWQYCTLTIQFERIDSFEMISHSVFDATGPTYRTKRDAIIAAGSEGYTHYIQYKWDRTANGRIGACVVRGEWRISEKGGK